MRLLRTLLYPATVVALLLSMSAATAQPRKGEGGKLSATISIMPAVDVLAEHAADGGMWFDVTRSRWDHKDTIWVTNTCYDDVGQVVTDRDDAVKWGEWNSLEGEAGPFETAGETCTAYVTTRPWQDKPLGDAVVVYTP